MSVEDNKDHNRKEKRDNPYRSMANFTQAGFTMAASVLIGVLLGRWIDQRLNTDPIFLLVFSLLGVVAALRSLFYRPEDRK